MQSCSEGEKQGKKEAIARSEAWLATRRKSYSYSDFEGALAMSTPSLPLGKCSLTKKCRPCLQNSLRNELHTLHTPAPCLPIFRFSEPLDHSFSQHLGSHQPYTSHLDAVIVAGVPNCLQNKVIAPSQSAHLQPPAPPQVDK